MDFFPFFGGGLAGRGGWSGAGVGVGCGWRGFVVFDNRVQQKEYVCNFYDDLTNRSLAS